MTKLYAISSNTFLQTVRQPIYGILVLATLGAFVLSPPLTGWTLDDDNKLLRDMGLSTLLMQGLFLAAFSATAVVTLEIEQKTVLSTVSKPVSRGLFILGKALGVFAAVTLAYYLATIAFVFTMRHGVLQMAAESSDMTVIVFGPGMVILMLVAAGVLNYLFDWKFLPTAVTLIAVSLTVSAILLTFVDRDWKFSKYQTTQRIDRLPAEMVTPDMLKGLLTFQPDEGYKWAPGSPGLLIRDNFKGPITDEERSYLRGLSSEYKWGQQLDFLVTETRKITTPDMLKAAYLILLAVLMLSAAALAASTRLGTVPTLLICVVLLAAGLISDHFLQPLANEGVRWAQIAYRIVPNFQFLWLIDALTDDRVIPWAYVWNVTGYAAIFIAAFVALAAALFETREVG